MTWIRVDSKEPYDPSYERLAEVLGLSAEVCFAKVMKVRGGVAEHAPEGDLSRVPDGAIETWASWQGIPGAFARAFREEFVSDGELSAWAEKQGKLIARARAERVRKAAERAQRNGSRSADRTRTREP